MTELRLIQNFAGHRALIVSEAPAAVAQLELTLARLGLTVVHAECEAGNVCLAEEFLVSNQTVLFIDADMNVAIEASGHEGLLPIAVVGIIGAEAPSRLRSIMRMGATAIVRKPVYSGAVYSALFMGINAFRQRRTLQLQLAEQDRRRHGRRYVIKAVLQVMKAADCNEDAAYDRLRREAMRQRLSIEDYCENFMRVLPGAHDKGLSFQGATCPEKAKQGGNQL